jgi:site-specific recombinase XerC
VGSRPQLFFTWALAEGELEASPMAGMRPPQIPEIPVPILTEDQLRRLLKACDGRDFAARRDSAIIRPLIDTGLRRGECAGIMLDDLDLDDQVVTVLGKGRRPRVLAYGRKTALALDRYLRTRAGHPHAVLPNLWIGRNGAMTASGVFQVVADRGGPVRSRTSAALRSSATRDRSAGRARQGRSKPRPLACHAVSASSSTPGQSGEPSLSSSSK